jgi:lysozyme family protein
MSTFELAIYTILKHEGSFTNNPTDRGGATKYGISQRFLSHLTDEEVTIEDMKNLTKETAIKLYKTYWWDRYNYNTIVNQSIATKVFDLAINMGPYYAHRLLQRACWKVNKNIITELKDDGILGPITMNIVNNLNPTFLLSSLQNEAAEFYRSLHKPEFEKGWLTRLYDEYRMEN